jgi:hypothetical protein
MRGSSSAVCARGKLTLLGNGKLKRLSERTAPEHRRTPKRERTKYAEFAATPWSTAPLRLLRFSREFLAIIESDHGALPLQLLRCG